jgi:hypothetical protein
MIYGTNCGVYLTSSSNNSINYCDIIGNSIYGLYITSTSNFNLIHHNNLFNNDQNAYDKGSNYWDDGSEGNYWDDYTGSDLYSGVNQDEPGSDGIGDTPYNISGGTNKDRYPLMSPWNVSVNIPPVVNITYPPDNETVIGAITISGNASDSDGNVITVYVKINNGTWEPANGTTSWSFVWNTSTVSNGWHTIYARAFDGIDYSDVVSVSLYVDNFINLPDITAIIWAQDIRLSIDPSDSFSPEVAIDSYGNIHIVWVDNRDGNDEIYYKKLDSNMNILINDTRLTFDSNQSGGPTIAIDSNNDVHIVWSDYNLENSGNVWYTKLDGYGNVLIGNTIINDAILEIWGALKPCLGIDSCDNIYVFWCNGEGAWDYGEIWFTKLDNKGNVLIDDKLIVEQWSVNHPTITIDSNDDIHLVWGDTRDDPDRIHKEIYYKKINKNGTILVNDTRLTVTPPIMSGFGRCPSIAVDSNDNIHVTWQDDREGNIEIYYMKLNNSGAILVEEERLTFNSSASQRPVIGVDTSNNIYIVWEDQRDGTREIYYTKLDNSGAILIEDTILSDRPHDSVGPALAVNKYIHIVWYDKRDGNWEIYCKGTASNITFSNPNPVEGETITISATIYNIGNVTAYNLTVQFSVSIGGVSLPVLIGTYNISSISPCGTETVSMEWIIPEAGNHTIMVIIDPEGLINESNELNNHANKSITVSAVNQPPTY